MLQVQINPIEIINKYRSRGFRTILNENEIKRLLEYSSVVPKWQVKYDLILRVNRRLIVCIRR